MILMLRGTKAMKCALLALVLACHGQPKTLQASRAAMYGALGADLASTFMVPGREGNPTLGQHPGRIAVTAVGLTVGADVLTYQLKDEHPRLVTTFNFVVTGAHSGAVVWNIKLGRSK